MDSEATVDYLKGIVQDFCDERNWDEYHTAKDLSIGIITEASELLEHFRFKSNFEIDLMLQEKEKRAKIGEELADVFYFILLFSQKYGFDLTAELLNKIEVNNIHYPISKAKDSNKKYKEFD